MKNFVKFCILLLFFMLFCGNFAFFSSERLSENFSYAQNFSKIQTGSEENLGQNLHFKYDINGRIFEFGEDDGSQNLSKFQIELKKNLKESYFKLSNFGLTKKEIITYLCPEVNGQLEKLKKITNKNEVLPRVLIEKNKCQIIFDDGKPATFLDEEDFFEKLGNQILSGKTNFFVKIKTKNFCSEKNFRSNFVEKSCFSTNFSTSSDARKNNIKVALEAFDGLCLEDGEILSFNLTTGERVESAGYKRAKIISGGTFTEGFGGGVCQVSTTLYNACLLAGLEIVEVHSHSLPVSYIEPSFDAMVNSGSSDLVIKNNSGGKLVFATSSENDTCKIKIFGKKNKYKITRISEKTKIIKAEPEIIETDYKKYGDFDLEKGEEKRLSYAKDGFSSKGYLNFYDRQGSLIKTKQIRENTYHPTKGIILKNDNDD